MATLSTVILLATFVMEMIQLKAQLNVADVLK